MAKPVTPPEECGPIWCIGECVRDAALAALDSCNAPHPDCLEIDTCPLASPCCSILHVELGVPKLEGERRGCKDCPMRMVLPIRLTLGRCNTVDFTEKGCIEAEARQRSTDRWAMRRLDKYISECLAEKLGVGCCLKTKELGGRNYCGGGCAGTTYDLEVVLP